MIQDGKEFKVNIFVASSGELNDERDSFGNTVLAVGKNFPHLALDVVRWETDLESGSVDNHRIQDAINPYLEKSQLVFVLVYSRLGEYTLEEYNLAMTEGKKVFLYFKDGFSPRNNNEMKTYQKVVDFRQDVIDKERTLFKSYKNLDQFSFFVQQDLNRYLSEKYPRVSPDAKGETAIPKYLTPLPVKSVELVGRETELEEMTRRLEHAHRVLLVNGLGGVGKTELCKRYFRDHCGDYRHLAWVDVVGSVRESVVAAFTAETTGFREDDTVDQRFEKIMDLLVGLDTHCLLVADNIENPGDPDLDRLRSLPVKVIANSRLTIEGFENHPLDFLSAEGCKELFYNFYTGKRDDPRVEKIVRRCGRHTLSVELLAKTAEHGAMPLKDLYELLEKKGFDLTGVVDHKVLTSWHGETEKTSFFEHLLKIFDLTGLTDGERFVLANLSVLPAMYIETGDVRDWLKLTDPDAVNSLVVRGWLRKEAGGFGIFMHQVIQEVVRYHTSPDEETCKNLIVSLANKLYLEPGENPMDKKRYIIFAETLLRTIDKTDESLANLSNNLAEIYRHMGSLKKALEFQLKALNIREQVLDKNHPDLAQSYNNVSLIYKDLGQPEKALEFQLKALNIFEQVLDKNHPDLAVSYNNLALIYVDLTDYESAETYGEKAVAILQHLFPNGHPNLEIFKRNLEWIRKRGKG